ncbi:MAG: GAF domain-containing protein [Ignavibacteriae bacterium]|nr:GAF domain-containing protein [Ignavibacteriota bacterium]
MKNTVERKKGIQRSKTIAEMAEESVIQKHGILRRLNLFYEITSRVDGAESYNNVLDVLNSEAKRLISYDVCVIGLLNDAKSHYIIHTIPALSEISDLTRNYFSIDEGVLGWVIKHQASLIEDINSGPVFSEPIEGKLRDLGITSLLGVPMKTGKEIVGSLIFGSSKPAFYTEEDATIANFLGLYLATSLKYASSFQKERKRLSQIELINAVTRQLSSMLQLDDLLRVAACAIQRTFNYFDVTVLLLSEDKTELILEAHSGNFADFLPHGYKQNVDKGIIGWVATHGEKVLSNDVSQDPRYIVYEYHNTKSELTVPIKLDNEVVGVLNVEDTKLHAFDEIDAMVLETLCDQLGIAINNAKLYDELRQANMKLTELDKMKSEFLGMVSHDFRSPLSSIMLAARSLLKNKDIQNIQRAKEYLQLVVDQANRLNKLAEDTLSITKIESGQLSYYFKIVNIDRLIQDAVSMVRFSSKHKFEYRVEPNALFIMGDQAKLRQTLQNLVSNAVKYSPSGGKTSILCEEHSSTEIVISVSDEGIGISPDKVDKLFKKFSRIDTDQTKEIKGAGLGLWICREIIQAHGGRIWVESEPGKGSTFKFTLKKMHHSEGEITFSHQHDA